jgi:putative membrane protein
MDGGSGWWMGAGSLVFIALVVLVVVLVVRHEGGTHESSASNAEDILAERFARGEIDEDEYRRRRAALH